MVEESLEQSRKLKSPWKASHVGTARMLLEHVDSMSPLPKTQVNSGERDKDLRFQFYPMAGMYFQIHLVLR